MKHKSTLYPILLFLIAAFTAFVLIVDRESEGYEVLRVADGDSFSLIKGGKELEIRLYGIDCPERTQPFHNKAKKFTGKMLQSGEIRIKAVDRDRYGRTVAWVYVDSLSVNEALVRHGLAWHYKHHSADENLARLEEDARVRHVGLWSDPNSIPPWQFRKREKPGLVISRKKSAVSSSATHRYL